MTRKDTDAGQDDLRTSARTGIECLAGCLPCCVLDSITVNGVDPQLERCECLAFNTEPLRQLQSLGGDLPIVLQTKSCQVEARENSSIGRPELRESITCSFQNNLCSPSRPNVSQHQAFDPKQFGPWNGTEPRGATQLPNVLQRTSESLRAVGAEGQRGGEVVNRGAVSSGSWLCKLESFEKIGERSFLMAQETLNATFLKCLTQPLPIVDRTMRGDSSLAQLFSILPAALEPAQVCQALPDIGLLRLAEPPGLPRGHLESFLCGLKVASSQLCGSEHGVGARESLPLLWLGYENGKGHRATSPGEPLPRFFVDDVLHQLEVVRVEVRAPVLLSVDDPPGFPQLPQLPEPALYLHRVNILSDTLNIGVQDRPAPRRPGSSYARFDRQPHRKMYL